MLRDAHGPVSAAELRSTWPDEEQYQRALAGLVSDGLVVEVASGHLALPD
jgi:A/G-specific adenine glycosylase